MPVFPPSGGAAGGAGSVAFFDEGSAIGTGTNLNFVGPGTATFSGGTAIWTSASTVAVALIIDGNGSAISTGVKAYVEVPFAATIRAARMFGDTTGSAVVDIWKDTYANYPPTVADTITASAKPTIAGAVKSQDTTLTGWTTAISAGDVLGFNVDSCSTITKLTVSLTVQKT